MKQLDIEKFSTNFTVRKLEKEDISEILSLCEKNTLYYKYCPPFVTEQSIIDDMNALPPRKTKDSKSYVGYYTAENELVAVMDLITDFPDEGTAFLGFFMTDVLVQNKGTGSDVIEELCAYLSDVGAKSVRLAWVEGNPQAEHFWHKNGFKETGAIQDAGDYSVVVAERILLKERVIDDEIKLIPYYRNDEVSLPWYQDLDVCKQVDNRDEPYDSELLHRMYDYLSSHGACYYIEFRGELVGDVSLQDNGEVAIVVCKEYQDRHIGRRCIKEMIKLANEKGMEEVKANIYSFNTQSQRMFESIGFKKTDVECYNYKI